MISNEKKTLLLYIIVYQWGKCDNRSLLQKHTFLIWVGLVTGRGGGGLLGGFGLGFGATDGDGWELGLVSVNGGVWFFCCSLYVGTGGGLTTGRTAECLDLGVPEGFGCWLDSCGQIATILHYAALKPPTQLTDTKCDITLFSMFGFFSWKVGLAWPLAWVLDSGEAGPLK